MLSVASRGNQALVLLATSPRLQAELQRFAGDPRDPILLRPWVRGVLSLLGAAVIAGGMGGEDGVAAAVDRPWVVWLIAVTAVPIPLARLRWPRATLATAAVLAVSTQVLYGPLGSVTVAFAIALYTVASTQQTTSRVVAATAVAWMVVLAVVPAQTGSWDETFELLVIVAFAGAAAEASRSRAEALGWARSRAHRAELDREAEARRRVAEDRIGIARDLHDGLAHQIAVINLHTGVAARAVASRPEVAAESLAVVGSAAQAALAEVSAILALLRRASELTHGHSDVLAGLEPIHLPDLVARFREAGLLVDATSVTRATELPERVAGVAYRVVQEALTNAHKHGSAATARLEMTRTDTELVIEVTNPVAGETSDLYLGSGHGLLGMRERVAALGGYVNTTLIRDDRFHLVARLPLAMPGGLG